MTRIRTRNPRTFPATVHEDRPNYLLDTEAPFAAGEGWTCSDTNYIVLAMIPERITGTEADEAAA
jgi:CubicO group peptidase (beta-lactamase class C family)